MTSPDLPYSQLPSRRRVILGRWVAVWAVMVVLTVIIGGITRLTESGLSITEWAPISGVLPPLTDARWDEAFRAYQQIPEYQKINQGMTLAQFKSIYFWEYVHRAWARLVGLVLAVPLLVFWLRRWLVPALTRRLVALLALTGAQAALGWFMVVSGLADRTDVSQYRLAAHLGLALIIYVIAVWTAADLLVSPVAERRTDTGPLRSLRRQAGLLTGLIFLTVLAGAFVAGIDGGKAYNTFPLMGGQLIPAAYFALDPWWRNAFDNIAAVQFNHRWIGIFTLAAIAVVWWRGRPLGTPNGARRWLNLLPLIALLQVALGVATLLLAVPVTVAVLHQLGAVALLTASVLLYHRLERTALQRTEARGQRTEDRGQRTEAGGQKTEASRA